MKNKYYIKTRWLKTFVNLVVRCYDADKNQPALQLFNAEDGAPEMTVTRCLIDEGHMLSDNQAFIKDVDENAGILRALEDLELIEINARLGGMHIVTFKNELLEQWTDWHAAHPA
tara:strand:+ start:43158 stop:43502 length:345 start_codon:yes stop_codon:yes gene_type:complete